ncbi:hypothetical protein SAMN06295937_10073 [Sphingopyxis flava]|uniref:Uncharacterized protein n=1 Tax=Sphingopyxis flava TaxID=1507287 RepID=A0A1T5BMV3_9SPHN|nr:hypothetical protein SAMN06295937_10073 [Sphingopyxis flava]
MDNAGARPPGRQHMDKPPGCYISPDHHRRKLNDAHASHRGFAQCRHVISNETRPVRNDRLLTIVMAKPPTMLAMRGAEIEARQPSKIAWR